MRPALLLIALAVPTLATADTAADLTPQVRALVEKWTAAQNGGDFKAYEALYAARFTGIRRSGPRMVKLDRKGWLADRARMFQKKMTVTVDDLQIASAGSMARVVFTQTWSSGSYRDVGPKQLVVIPEGGALRIAREELLASQKVGARGAAGRDQYLQVFEGELVLDASPDEKWATGGYKLEPDGPQAGEYVASRKVDVKQLPPELAAWSGRKVKILGAKTCDATVGTPHLTSRVIPHFGTVQEWRENKLSKARIAEAVHDLGSPILSAPLTPTCDGFARAANLPTPTVVQAEKAPSALEAAARAEFRRLPAWKEIQKSFKDEGALDGKWDDEGVTVEVINHPGATLVLASSKRGNGCGEFTASLSAIWEVSAGPKPKFTLRNKPSAALEIEAASDVDGDGVPELLLPNGILRRQASGLYEDPEVIEVRFLDCPC